MSDSVRPQRWQPTRLFCPWDSPGKNTGVGCHFLLQCMRVKSKSEVAQSCQTLRDPMDCSPPGSSIHGIFLGVGCHCLLWVNMALGVQSGRRSLSESEFVDESEINPGPHQIPWEVFKNSAGQATPREIKSDILGESPRHQYFLKLPWWLHCAVQM